MDISHLTHTSVDDCHTGCHHATLEQLEAAAQWCLDHPAGNKSRAATIASHLRKRRLSAQTAALIEPKPKPPGLPSDLELLKTASLPDCARIASVTSRENLIAAIRWLDTGEIPLHHQRTERRAIIAQALQEGGSK